MVSNKVTVVSAFVPLDVLHMKAEQYKALGERMFVAAREGGARTVLRECELSDCWSHDLCKFRKPATDTPPDRYATPEAHVRSHVVQHTRTQWALEAYAEYPDSDVIVWLDLGIMKQGNHTGKPISDNDVTRFVEAVKRYQFDDIPFPGMTGREPWLPHGNNWRFCGSTHIWPVKWLAQIDRAYRYNLRHFIHEYDAVPLDLAIWPLVEGNSGLPFRWYQAEYDHTQLRNFPCAP